MLTPELPAFPALSLSEQIAIETPSNLNDTTTATTSAPHVFPSSRENRHDPHNHDVHRHIRAGPGPKRHPVPQGQLHRDPVNSPEHGVGGADVPFDLAHRSTSIFRMPASSKKDGGGQTGEERHGSGWSWWCGRERACELRTQCGPLILYLFADGGTLAGSGTGHFDRASGPEAPLVVA
ncbi:hypothetical protein K490DRAFT_69768 [Saccharata proteae CBS 121410]|uniref:Uncharacterized protein n=1 Tax=Saccharata proteae CBS 121410 TaxID=1314787 RepID=A0A9P4HPA9_9PEZI|nr:hypothetical protein K490DRAFT_69768 [Saccharata proteae CBS 121410]